MMQTQYYYPYWQSEHFLFILLTILAPIIVVRWSRKSDEKVKERIAKILAILLIGNFLAYQAYRISAGFWSVKYDLPLELCNWAIAVTAIALWTKNRRWSELAFFWVMAGSIHGIITPDIHEPFPHLTYITFVIGHSGLVLAVFYAVFGLGLKPQAGVVKRVMLISQLYLAVAFTVNGLLGSNYGYLMRKPEGGSFLDLLHEWPYYVLELQLIGLVSYTLIYLPFWWVNRRAGVETM
jgi:hypothetical integral membrane protein (TIGR02206 family)